MLFMNTLSKLFFKMPLVLYLLTNSLDVSIISSLECPAFGLCFAWRFLWRFGDSFKFSIKYDPAYNGIVTSQSFHCIRDKISENHLRAHLDR